MTEVVKNDYQCSSNNLRTWEIPYARLTDTTPTPSNPAEVTSLLAGTQLTGTIISIDAGTSVAVIDFAAGNVYYQEVRNVLTYSGEAENTFAAINIGDIVYYDNSATMPAGVYLSTSPLDNLGVANSLFGYVVPCNDVDRANYPLGAATASTQWAGIIQRGAGST